MNFPVKQDIRHVSQQIVSVLWSLFLTLIVATGTTFVYTCYSPIARFYGGTHHIERRVDSQQKLTRVISPLPMIRRTIWTVRETALHAMPGIGPEIARVSLHAPLIFQGYPCWMAGTLWLPVQWPVSSGSTSAWISAASVSFTAPAGNTRAKALQNASTSRLMAYFASLGPNVGLVVYDVTHQRYYRYQDQSSFLAASSIKVPIMLAVFDLLERQKREPNVSEMALLTAMIEHSDNDAASVLYFNELGGAVGLNRFLARYRIRGLSPEPYAWGYSSITPRAMVDLLTLVQQGKILTAPHRNLALSLMEHVESGQRWGVGDTAPAGATVALKNGWVPASNGRWAVNTSGIIIGRGETYIVAVYTREQPSLVAGEAMTRAICRAITSVLSP